MRAERVSRFMISIIGGLLEERKGCPSLAARGIEAREYRGGKPGGKLRLRLVSDLPRSRQQRCGSGVDLVFVKLGPQGTLVASKNSVDRVPSTPVSVVNGLGLVMPSVARFVTGCSQDGAATHR
jgi:hypothetical protein